MGDYKIDQTYVEISSSDQFMPFDNFKTYVLTFVARLS